jgi:3-oxoacyl-[acyl-carrier protein] reductase
MPGEGVLEGRVAVVTGASRGIGRAVAEHLAQLGASVVVNYRTQADAARAVVAGIAAGGGVAEPVEADVSQADAVDALFRQTLTRFGRCDILINNAGIIRDNLLLRLEAADFDSVVETNLKGAFLCARSALKPMLRQRFGRIVNMTSVVGLHGNPGQTNYAAAKAGLIGLTRSLAKEVGSRQITVNAVAPGFIETDITAHLGETSRTALLDRVPLGRLGTADDVAGLVGFLCTPAASYITGQVISIDGGLVL